MSDMIESVVADTIDRFGGVDGEWETVVEHIIAAATPHIRAALFDELIAKSADQERDWNYTHHVTTWLREMKENTQP